MNGYGSPLSVAVSRPVPVSPDFKAELTITLQSSLQVPHRHHRRNVLEHNRGRHTSVVLFRLAIVDAMGIDSVGASVHNGQAAVAAVMSAEFLPFRPSVTLRL